MEKYSSNVYDIIEDNRVKIGRTFENIPMWRKVIGIPLIYLPVIIALPFMIVALNFVKWHLVFIGGKNLKNYRDFLPHRKSYRYAYKNQIISKGNTPFSIFARTKIFWFYNCGIYCPFSVALLDYFSYLVKIVENWWCPFYHDKKSGYASSSIDKSFWHIDPKMKAKMNKDDVLCSIFDDEAPKKKGK